MKVLVIDDDAMIRLIAKASLSRPDGIGAGMVVIEAASGAEGVRKAQDERPDVILLDVMMPVMDGTATLAALRSDAATAGIPVIFLTAMTADTAIERLKALGAAGVLIKPFDPRTFEVDVRRLLTSLQAPAAAQ